MKMFGQIILAVIIFTILIVFFIIRPIDYVSLFMPLTPILKTDEHKLVFQDGLMYKEGKPFNGTAVFRGLMETYPSTVTAFDSQTYTDITTQKGKRVTPYLNGLKEGKERIYYTYQTPMWYGGPTMDRSMLHAEIHYKRGVKNGLEIIYEFSGRIEANYKEGLLDGLYREFHMIEDYRKKEFPNGIGPLKVEAEYHKGCLDGFYRSYTQYGDTSENYVMRNGKVIEGRVRTVKYTITLWQWYNNGYLTEEQVFDHSSVGRSIEPPLVENTLGGNLVSETFYDNGVVIEMRLYNTKNNKVHLHKKRINGELIEIFNRETGVDRTVEFAIH